MSYKALYRTYRPSTFDEVAGQQHIVKTIKNALATGKIAHAYLFAGPRGTGKTTMAKLLAKALNCEHGIGEQCNECKNCRSINEGNHPDVLEIDAASNNGVEEIRDLIDKVKYGTILGKYKVYIIDEVHMMTPAAFNALLKTLEEPPEHVIFILATTEPHKILPTILSRCQRYDFSKVSDADICERIKVILEKENIPYDEKAVKLIISLADGGMRDALSILDQVLAYSGNQLNERDILDIFSLESTEEKISLLSLISRGEIKGVLEKLNGYISRGTDIKRLTNDLLIILKDVLIYQNTGSLNYFEVLNEGQAEQLSTTINGDVTLQMIEALMDTIKDYKNVTAINPLFEVTLLKLASFSQKPTIIHEKPIVKELKKEEEKAEEIPTPAPVIQPTIIKPQPVEEITPAIESPIELSEDIIYLNGSEKETTFEVEDNAMIEIMVTSKKEIKNNLLENWKNLKRIMAHPHLGKIAALLIDGRPLVASNNILILEFQLTSLVEKANAKENQADIQNVVKNVFGKKMFVYAVNRSDSVRLQQKYMNLLQLGKLPKADSITLDMIGD